MACSAIDNDGVNELVAVELAFFETSVEEESGDGEEDMSSMEGGGGATGITSEEADELLKLDKEEDEEGRGGNGGCLRLGFTRTEDDDGRGGNVEGLRLGNGTTSKDEEADNDGVSSKLSNPKFPINIHSSLSHCNNSINRAITR